MKFQISNFKFQIRPAVAARERGLMRNAQFGMRNFAAFSLVEVLVVITLMSLIVLALMQVFSTTQQAFRASVTQQDVLEGSRATVDMITADLRQLVPSDNASNSAVNFFSACNYNSSYNNTYLPLVQNLPGSSVPRTNLLNWFFVLGRINTKWIGVGYVVDNTNSSLLYPLYRYYRNDLSVQSNPVFLFNDFTGIIYAGQWTNASMSHVMDGVVHLVLRAYDTNGVWMNNNLRAYTNVQNALFLSPAYSEAQFYMYSNAVPAAVELQLGVLEDRTLSRAESLGIPGQPPSTVAAQWSYLTNQSGSVHLFRQRVTIQNVDPSAYQ
jgi:type II secretory pathway pseudopilin PulG